MAFETFHLFIVDHDNKRFSAEGPLNDDFLWRDRVIREQKMGRNMECFSLKGSSIEPSIKHYIKKSKYEFIKKSFNLFS